MWQALLASEIASKKAGKSGGGSGSVSTAIPGWAKGIIYIIVIALLAFIGYKLFKKYFSEEGVSGREDVKDTQEDLNDLIKKGVKPTYKQSQYSSWAATLKEAFDGCGTDNGAWERIFPLMKNDADVLALNATFGQRVIDGCNWQGDFGEKTHTLPQAIQSELSSGEIKELNNMLVKNRIKFQY
jgi:hypothetical protein